MRQKQQPDLRTAIKMLLLLRPDLGLTQLQSELRRIGFEVASLTVSGVRNEFLDTLDLLQELGMINEKKLIREPDWLYATKRKAKRRRPQQWHG
jgi:hypothetical protein